MAATCQVFSRGLTYRHTNAVKTPGGLQKMVTGVVQDKIFYTEVKLKQKDLLFTRVQSYDGSFCKAGPESQLDDSPGSSLLGFV